MTKLYNLGCSFAYGNCVPTRNELCEEHRGPGTYVAEYLGYEEINLACNGNSSDGVLRRLYTEAFDQNSIILIGIPPAGRYQIIKSKMLYHNKRRKGKASLLGRTSKAQTCMEYAYTKGPVRTGDYFYTQKWSRSIKDDIVETANYYVLFNILKMQTKLRELGIEHYIYNSVSRIGDPDNAETQSIKQQIDWLNYYRPDYSIYDIVSSNVEYELAEGDQHPNHLAYKVWSDDFCNWLEEKRKND